MILKKNNFTKVDFFFLGIHYFLFLYQILILFICFKKCSVEIDHKYYGNFYLYRKIKRSYTGISVYDICGLMAYTFHVEFSFN